MSRNQRCLLHQGIPARVHRCSARVKVGVCGSMPYTLQRSSSFSSLHTSISTTVEHPPYLRWMRTAAGADAHNSDGGSCGGPAQQRGGCIMQRRWQLRWMRTAAVAEIAVDRHSNEVDAHSSDGGCAQQRRRLAVDAHSSDVDNCVDVHNSGGGRGEQRCQREPREEDETTAWIRGNQWLVKRNAKKIIYLPNFKP
ncbi:hypothetical protein DEO72_LG4g655 [Vigna unguiculata]|uniref:Uncharacterized protein n=1 Tax=Vigna unguiculata TaxID=3917 RepID=A0A4D6LLP5_VIGUN|nr:hypothetical protein DEO72_LG4g655 [Vigna unguiculata]